MNSTVQYTENERVCRGLQVHWRETPLAGLDVDIRWDLDVLRLGDRLVLLPDLRAEDQRLGKLRVLNVAQSAHAKVTVVTVSVQG